MTDAGCTTGPDRFGVARWSERIELPLFGDCVVESERHPLDGYRLRIIQADPRVLIDRRVFSQIIGNGPDHPVSVTAVDGWWYLRIRGDNRTAVYRITRFLPERDAFVGEWPD